LGRKKLNKNIIAEEQLENKNIELILLKELKELPSCWTRGFSIPQDEKERNKNIDLCFEKYEIVYGHKALEGWSYTNLQDQQTIYLKLEKGDGK
jgi:hypothetical protein